MSVMLLILIALLAIIGFTVLHYSVVLGILTFIIAVTLVVLNFIIFNKFSKLLRNVIMWAGTVICLLLFWLMKPQSLKYHLIDYSMDMIKVEKMISSGNSKAEKQLEKMEEKYGETDSILGLNSYLCLMNEDFDGAYDYMYRTSDHTSKEYYRRMEFLYMVDGRTDTTWQLYNMYEEAAKNHTDWGYIQRMEGISKFEQQKYDSAEYYLLSAVTIDDEDAMAYYYLGAVYCEKAKYDEAKEYFKRALKYGVSDEVASWIAWYEERMG